MENNFNDFQTTLAAPVGEFDTSIVVTAGRGDLAPDFRIRVKNEWMLVTSIGAGTNWTVVRAQEGSTAAAYTASTKVVQVLTRQGLLNQIAGALIGLTTLALGGNTVTASAAPLSITQTWNNAAVVFDAFTVDVTDSASNVSSRSLDLRLGGVSKFSVRKDGFVTIIGGVVISGGLYPGYLASSLNVNNQTLSNVNAIAGHATSGVNLTNVVTLSGLTAGVIEQRAATTGQTFRVYNTYTDASNYKRGVIDASNTGGTGFLIASQGAGTGSTGMPIYIDVPTGMSINFSHNNTGSTRWTINSSGHFVGGLDNSYDIGASGATRPRSLYLGGTAVIDGALSMGFGAGGAGVALTLGQNVLLYGEAAHVLAQRNGANGQTYRLYNTYTDVSNYERGYFRWTSNQFRIGVENAGTGAVRDLIFQSPGVANTIGFAFNGSATNTLNVSWDRVYLADAAFLGWASLRLRYGGTSGYLDQQNGAVAQAYRLFSSYTDASNHEYLSTGFSGASRAILTTVKLGTGTQRNLQLGGTTGGASGNIANIVLWTDGTIDLNGLSAGAWSINTSRHLLPAGTTNTLDLGASGSLVRSLYWGTQLLGPFGSESVPSYAFAGTSGANASGMYFVSSGNQVALSSNSTTMVAFAGNETRFGSTQALGWSSNANPTAAVADLALFRGGAGILEQRNGTNVQNFYLYNTYTDASNFERLKISWSHAANTMYLLADALGTGTGRNVVIGGAASMYLFSGGALRWQSDTNGHLLPVVTSAQQIGSASNMVNNVYASTIQGGAGQVSIVGGSTSFIFTSDVFEQYRGVQPQAYRLYNTRTDASNYERGFIKWSSNNLFFGAESLGTGATRDVWLEAAAANNVGFSKGGTAVWYVQATTHNFIPTAANTRDLGTNTLTVRTGYFGTSVVAGIAGTSTGSMTIGLAASANSFISFGGTANMVLQGRNNSTGYTWQLLTDDTGSTGDASFRLGSGGNIGFNSVRNLSSGAVDLFLTRGGAGILEQRNGTNAQSSLLYNTWTDASNYERGFMRWNTNLMEIGVEAAGTGTYRELWLLPANPTTGHRFKFGNGIISDYYAGTSDERGSLILHSYVALVADAGAGVYISSTNTSLTGSALLVMYTSSNTQTTQVFRCNRKNEGGGYTGAGHHLSIYAGQAATSGVGGAGGNLLLAGGAAADVGGAAFNGGDLFLDGGSGINAGLVGNVVFNSVTAGGVKFNRYADFVEMAAPAAPAADTGRVFFQDNGAGKTQMMVIFATGAAQQIAIQP